MKTTLVLYLKIKWFYFKLAYIILYLLWLIVLENVEKIGLNKLYYLKKLYPPRRGNQVVRLGRNMEREKKNY